MSDTLEAQARELTAACMAHGSSGGIACVDCITAWAHRLLAESRVGALQEARKAVLDAESYISAYQAICALTAEAEPGAQG